MIDVTLTPAGTVGLRPTTSKDVALVRELQYVRRSGNSGATFWTYLSDLRRDLGGRIRWSPSVPSRLRALISEVDARERGNDEEVLRLFSETKRPYPFQLRGIHAVVRSRRILIADDVGLGKTWQTIGAMLSLFASGKIRRAVLVVPAGLKLQWYEEVCDLARNPPKVLVVSAGSKAKRRRAYASGWQVLIINPELILRDASAVERIARGVDFVALDEASCIRNGEAATARRMKSIFRATKYKVALTATPIENRLSDLWSIVEWLDPRIFLSKEYFDGRYVVWRRRRFSVMSRKLKRKVRVTKDEPKGYRHLSEVRAKIRPVYIRRRVQDVGLELPPIVVSWENLELSKRQRELYDALKERVVERCDGLRGAALRSPLQALRQVCDSTALVERGANPATASHVKVDRLRELLSTEMAGERVILFTDYERFARLLADRLREHRPVLYTGEMDKQERAASIAAFVAGTRRVLVGTRAVERGHNLQVAGVVVNVDLPFNPAAIKQRLGRVRRIGSTHATIRMVNMIARGTVEEKLILRKIYAKRKLFEGIFDEDELSEADPVDGLVGRDLRSLL